MFIHYNLENRLMKILKLKTLVERFLYQIQDSDHPNGCWIWEGELSHNGYGRIRINKTKSRKPTHRFSYELFVGEIPKGKFVCHTCDNPPCVNPEHLWIGTHKENMLDMIKKGRGGFNQHVIKRHKGSSHHKSKLKEKDVIEIRELSKSGMTHREISLKYKMHESTISGIILRRNWNHI